MYKISVFCDFQLRIKKLNKKDRSVSFIFSFSIENPYPNHSEKCVTVVILCFFKGQTVSFPYLARATSMYKIFCFLWFSIENEKLNKTDRSVSIQIGHRSGEMKVGSKTYFDVEKKCAKKWQSWEDSWFGSILGRPRFGAFCGCFSSWPRWRHGFEAKVSRAPESRKICIFWKWTIFLDLLEDILKSN